MNRYTESISLDEVSELRDRILVCPDLESVRKVFRNIIKDILGSSSKV